MSSVGKHALFVIDIAPAKAILSDGRNAHVCLHEEAWWQQRLIQFFPDIRPFYIDRPHRACFRTWDEEFPSWRRYLIEFRAKVEFKLHKTFSKKRQP